MAYILWCVISILFAVLGVYTRLSKKPIGAWTFTGAPDIPEERIKSYNSEVSYLWFFFAAALLLLGTPLRTAAQNSIGVLPSVLGVIPLAVFLMYRLSAIENKYKQK